MADNQKDHIAQLRADMDAQEARVKKDLELSRLREADERTAEERARARLRGQPSEFTHVVMAFTNLHWPLASVLPQVAFCGFFCSEEEAVAYRDKHMVIETREDGTVRPRTPILFVLPTKERIIGAVSPQRMWGAQAPTAAKKRDRLVREYFLKRDIERRTVYKKKEQFANDHVQSGKDGLHTVKDSHDEQYAKAIQTWQEKRRKTHHARDPVVIRAELRRARREAKEVMDLLRAQAQKIKALREGTTAMDKLLEDEDGDAEDEEAEFLKSLDECHRRVFEEMKEERRKAKAAEKTKDADEGEDVDEGEAADEGEDADKGEDATDKPKSKMMPVEDYIEYMEKYYEKRGIRPATNEEMDKEEEDKETEYLTQIATSREPRLPSGSLPPPPTGQCWCLCSVIRDTTTPKFKFNSRLKEAAGREHVYTAYECVEHEDEARERLQKKYKDFVTEENISWVRMGTWCCFDRLTEDDGQRLYHEETLKDIVEGQSKNVQYEFYKKHLESNPTHLPMHLHEQDEPASTK